LQVDAQRAALDKLSKLVESLSASVAGPKAEFTPDTKKPASQ
jgi:hypothetical protein